MMATPCLKNPAPANGGAESKPAQAGLCLMGQNSGTTERGSGADKHSWYGTTRKRDMPLRLGGKSVSLGFRDTRICGSCIHWTQVAGHAEVGNCGLTAWLVRKYKRETCPNYRRA
jgi:hypothetical protein